MNLQITQWLIFTASLSGRSASTPRVRLWRALKDLGAATLRDGVTLLPATDAHREKLLAIGEQVEAEGGGTAWLFEVPAQISGTEDRLRDAFDRSDTWQTFRASLKTLHTELPRLDEASARRRLRQTERELENIARIDFFPNEEQTTAREALEELTALINRRFSPAEPTATNGEVERLDGQDFSGRIWATRRHLWVDRVASAWLIRRFIDKAAHFAWLDKPEDCPTKALGFDFDNAAFTHVGERVTFEVLLASFGLDTDTGLAALGRLVHYLDVGGEPVAEAAGFEAVLAGLRESTADDDELLAATTPVLDALHRRFSAIENR
ncbi:MAG: chromate resistance protein [Thiogranum sp.]|nr:chromate resistance protein [Thiogranum sp.]